MLNLSHFHPHAMITFLEHASYAGVFLVSLLGGFFIPAPEAVLLMLVGFVASKGIINVLVALLFAIVGGILGDMLLFWLSLSGSRHISHFRRKLDKSKLVEYEHLVADNVGKAVFFLRFVAGVRFFAPIIVGASGASWRRFLFFDAWASVVNAILFVLLGYFFQKHIIFTVTTVEIIKNILLFFSALIASVLVGLFWKKEHAKKKKQAQSR